MCTDCFLVPPLVLSRIAANHPDPVVQASAKRTLAQDQALRTARSNTQLLAASHPIGNVGLKVPPPSTTKNLAVPKLSPQRTIYTAQQRNDLRATSQLRTEGSSVSSDPSANAAYDTLGIAYEYFATVHDRDSLDGLGTALVGIIHFADQYANAFWDGTGHMIFGDGDDQIILSGALVSAIDVVTHELTHAITQCTYQLNYSAQPGALNEHISDVFGTLARQWHFGISAVVDHWLIGSTVTGPALTFPDERPSGLRSMLNPGTANPYDQQPNHMSAYYRGAADHRGVHENSGIPNRAFALASIAVSGNAWETLGPIWYRALTTNRHPETNHRNARFTTFANNTITAATELHGDDHPHVEAIRNAWATVGILKP